METTNIRPETPASCPEMTLYRVCGALGLHPSEILTKCREAPLVLKKAKCAEYLRNEGYSYPQIGKIMNKHHTTVMGYFRHKKLRNPLAKQKIIKSCCKRKLIDRVKAMSSDNAEWLLNKLEQGLLN